MFASIFSFIIIKEGINLDEMWNYNTARCFANGLIPYKDISMITTPLLPAITGIILKLTFNGLITSRIINAILGVAILFVTYKIFNEVLKNRWTSAIITLIIEFYSVNFLLLDYNVFSLFLLLIILLIELKNKNKYVIDFALGVIAGLIICTKQTIGIVISFVCIVKPLIELIFEDKKTVKVKSVLLRILGVSLPVIILIIYLLINNAFSDFINYAILGIKEFNNYISYKKLLENDDIIIAILSVVCPMILD